MNLNSSLCSKKLLSNGLEVLLIPSKQAPVVAIQGWIRFGAADETDDIAGLAHLFEHLLFKGTSKRKVGQIAAEVEGLGGDLNAFTSYDQTVMHMTLSSHYLDNGLEILSDALKNSVVEEDELARERIVVLEEIKRRNDMPGARSGDVFREMLFKGHTYARPVIGYSSVVEKMSRESILENYKKYYNSKNIFLVLCGDFEEEKTLSLCEKYFSDIGPGPQPTPRSQVLAIRESQEQVVQHKSPFSLLHLGWQGVDGLHDDVAALDALSFIVGQGESSRLFKKLVLEENLLRDIAMGSWTPKDKGSIDISMRGDPKIEKQFSKIYQLIQECFQAPITSIELEKAKKNLLSSALYSQETVDGLANRFGFFECGGDFTEDQKYLEAVKSLDPSKLETVKEKYIQWGNVTLGGLVPEGEKAPKLPTTGKTKAQAPKVLSSKTSQSEIQSYNINGLKVLIKPIKNLPIFSMRWVGLGGNRLEKKTQAGIGNLWSRTVTNGGVALDGKIWTQTKILEELDMKAASLSAVHGRNSWGYYVDGMSEDLSSLCDLLFAIKENPIFDEKLLKDDVKRQLLDIKAAEDQPAQIAFRLFGQSLFGKDSSYGRSGLGEAQIVKKLNAKALKSYHQRMQQEPQVLSLVGDIQVDSFLNHLNDLIQKKRFPKSSALLKGNKNWLQLKDREVSQKLQKEQTHIVLGYPTCDMHNQDKWALSGMSAILGGQSGRLFIELRDKKSLCYTVSPSHMEAIDGGYFAFYIATSPDKVKIAIESLETEIEKFANYGFTQEEWQRAQSFYLGHYAIEQQRLASQASGMALDELYGLGFQEYFDFPLHFEKLQLETINKVAKKYFSQAKSKLKILSVVGTGR